MRVVWQLTEKQILLLTVLNKLHDTSSLSFDSNNYLSILKNSGLSCGCNKNTLIIGMIEVQLFEGYCP